MRKVFLNNMFVGKIDINKPDSYKCIGCVDKNFLVAAENCGQYQSWSFLPA